MQSKNWGNNKNQGQGGKRPNPARFNEFLVTKDGSGFTIKDTNYVFKFDRYGGWYDEDGFYYNENGQPCNPPKGRDDYDDYGYDDEDDGYDPADDWVKEYEDGDDDDKDEYEHIDKVYLNVENRRLLSQFLKDDKVDVQLKNLDYKTRKGDLENFLKSKKISILKIEYGQNHRGQFNGVCHLSVYKPDAEQLIQLNGSKYNGRDLKINVQPREGDDEDDIAVHEVGLGVNLNDIEEAIKPIEKPVEKPVEKTEPLIQNLGTLEGKKVIDVAALERELVQKQEAQKKATAPPVQQQQQQQNYNQQYQQQHHSQQHRQQQQQQHAPQQYSTPIQKNEPIEKGITAPTTQKKVEEKAPVQKTVEETVSDTGKWANGGALKKFAKKTTDAKK